MSFIAKNAPCYVYEEAEIQKACRELRTALPEFKFIYSVKSNPFLPVIQTIAKEGFGTDAASVSEVDKSLEAGVRTNRIYFSAPGRTEHMIRSTLGSCHFIADSLHEIRLAQKIASETNHIHPIGIRIHPLFVMGTGSAGPSKFGIDLSDMEALTDTLKECPNISVTGIHVHLKSQELDETTLADYYMNVLDTAIELEKSLGTKLEYVNFGSGIGIDYDPQKQKPVDLNRLHELLLPVIEKNRTTLNAIMIIETGRYLVCKAGRYYTPVVDKKVSRGITYLTVLNGMNGFLRPAIAAFVDKIAEGKPVGGMEPLFTGENEFEIRVLNQVQEQETVTVVGTLCTALDVVKNNVTMNKAEIGDIIEITNAGSYAYSLSPLTFSSHELPEQYLHTVRGTWVR